jgi:hypothetical protein
LGVDDGDVAAGVEELVVEVEDEDAGLKVEVGRTAREVELIWRMRIET